MNNNDGWLSRATNGLKLDFQAQFHVGSDMETLLKHDADLENPDPSITLWQRSSTTGVMANSSVSGAMILPKNPIPHSRIPRVSGWQKILRQIAKDTRCRNTDFVTALLMDIEFQHHQSTNGRWNASLKRYERFAVRSVEDWCKSGLNQRDRESQAPIVDAKTFHRVKDKLIDAGFIVAEAHLWNGKNHLWIKPSEELSRMLFEPGYVQNQNGPVKPQVKAGKLKPRGLSAMRAKIAADNHDLYRKAVSKQFNDLDEKMRWVVWERLTKPQHLTGEHYSKPYAAKNSYRWKNLYEALGLCWG